MLDGPQVDVAKPTVLVVHAHPDDEVFATAAATLAARAAGYAVALRVLTGGEGRQTALDPAGLRAARRRRAERLELSSSLLGIDSWAYVDEGRWTDTPHDPDRTLAAAPLDDVARAIGWEIDALTPTTILTVGPDGLTGHRDHIVCHRAVTRAVRQAGADIHVLGAVVDTAHVAQAQRRARELVGHHLGSGRVMGADTSGSLRIAGPADTEDRRRAALDAYTPGLGTADVTSLLDRTRHTSDSLLMRFVLDARGWDHDLVEPLPGSGPDVVPPASPQSDGPLSPRQS